MRPVRDALRRLAGTLADDLERELTAEAARWEPCRACGHPYRTHEHLRAGTDCSRCSCTTFAPIGVAR